MSSFKTKIKENRYVRMTCFILVNALLFCILYFVLKNFSASVDAVSSFFGAIFDAAKPFIIGLVIAYVLSPLVNFTDRKIVGRVLKTPADSLKTEKRIRLKEIISIVLSLIIVFAAVAFLIYSFAALILGQFSIKGMEETLASFMSDAETYQKAIEEKFNINISEVFGSRSGDVVEDISSWFSDNLSLGQLISNVTAIGGSVINFIIGIIFAIYLLLDKRFFISLWNRFIALAAPDNHEKINGTLHEVNDVLTSFIKGACVDSLIIAVLSSLCLTILGLEGAVVIGVFGGMANLIPYFGPVIGMVPAFFMGLVTDGFWTGAIAVIILFIIQQIDSNIIYPKVVGSQTGLRPLYVLFSITFLGYFGGIAGMLLAVPTAGVVQVFVLKLVKRRERKLMDKSAARSVSDVSVCQNDGTEGNDHKKGE